MKKTKKTLITAGIFAAALGLTACNGNNSSTSSDVKSSDTTVTENTDASEEEEVTEIVTNSLFDPGENNVPCIYGPPETFE